MSESKTRTVIQSTLEKDYKDTEFVRLMREIITENIERNKIYSEIVKGVGYNVDNLNNINDLESIPFLSTIFYKESENKFKRLLKIPEDKVLHWNCSSTTSGNPSLVGVNENDMEFLYEMSKKCYLDFIPRDWSRAKVYAFSPSAKFLDRICLRYTKLRPVRAYSGNYYTVTEELLKTKIKYLFSFSILKALKAIITTRSIVGGFYIKQTYFLETINKNLEKPEEERDYIAMGGSNHLINKFMEFMKEKNISYNLGNEFDVVVGGGGWDGHKAQMKYPPIDKLEFVSNIAKLFGTERKRVLDVYGFTECPIVFGSHWSDKHNDFIFHCPHYARIIIRDVKTLEPMKKEGDRGVLEVLTPFGGSASVKHAMMVDDHIELVFKHKCPECGYEGDTFRVLGRMEQSKGLGCSSVMTWV